MAKCFLCGRNGTADPLDEHHIFGGANRKKSEKYKLKVKLCHFRCHEFGEKAAHRNAETADFLHKFGQVKAMVEQGWSVEDFRLEIGRNFLDDPEHPEAEIEYYSQFIGEEGEDD